MRKRTKISENFAADLILCLSLELEVGSTITANVLCDVDSILDKPVLACIVGPLLPLLPRFTLDIVDDEDKDCFLLKARAQAHSRSRDLELEWRQ